MAVNATAFSNTPQARDDAYTLNEDALLGGNAAALAVMVNDLGGNAKALYSVDDGNGNTRVPDLALLTADVVNGVSIWEQTAAGNSVRISNGKVDFRLGETQAAGVNALAAGQQVSDEFVYAIRMGNGTLSQARVAITIAGANDAPVAVGDLATTPQGMAVDIQVLANDTDIDAGDSVSLVSAAGALHGEVILSGDTVRYTPERGFSGTDSFIYAIRDRAGATSSATVGVTVLGNLAPMANPDMVPESFLDLTGFTQYEPLPGMVRHYRLVAGDFTHNQAVAGATALGGYLVSIQLPPENQFIDDLAGGATAWIGASDAAIEGAWKWAASGPDDWQFFWFGGAAGSAQAYAHWAPGEPNNSDPGADFAQMGGDGYWRAVSENARSGYIVEVGARSGDPGVMWTEDQARSIPASFLLANDTDGDGDALSVVSVSAASAMGATLSLNGGTISYDPTGAAAIQAKHPHHRNFTDTFSYSISDGRGGTSVATATVTMVGANDAPVATDDVASTDEDTAVVIPVLENDRDPDTGDTIGLGADEVSDPQHGTVELLQGGLRYVPDADFHGTDSFTYAIRDTSGAADTATVSITVRPVPDAPTVDEFEVDEDHVLVGNVLLNDAGGDGLFVAGVVNGFDLPGGSFGFPGLQNYGAQVARDGTVDFDPAGYPGAQALAPGESIEVLLGSYWVGDGGGVYPADGALVWVSITGVNDAPEIIARDSVIVGAVTEDGIHTIDTIAGGQIVATDVDAGGAPPSWRVVNPATAVYGSIAVNESGHWTYTLDNASNAVQSLPLRRSWEPKVEETFLIQATDALGGSADQVVTIEVSGANDAPVAVDDTAEVRGDVIRVSIHPLTNDTDVDAGSLLSISNLYPNSNAIVVMDGQDPTAVNYWVTSDASIWRQSHTENEALADTFSYQVRDGQGGFDDGVVTVYIVGLLVQPAAG